MEAEHDEVLLNDRLTTGWTLSAAKDSTISIRGGIGLVLLASFNVVVVVENKKSKGHCQEMYSRINLAKHPTIAPHRGFSKSLILIFTFFSFFHSFYIALFNRKSFLYFLPQSTTMAPSNLPEAFNATQQDIEMLLAAQAHIGAKNVQVHMEPYVFKRRPDGINVINIGKTWLVLSFMMKRARVESTAQHETRIII